MLQFLLVLVIAPPTSVVHASEMQSFTLKDPQHLCSCKETNYMQYSQVLEMKVQVCIVLVNQAVQVENVISYTVEKLYAAHAEGNE